MIPKLLHFIWLGSPLPHAFSDNLAQWARLNADWDQVIWTSPPIDMFNVDLYENAERYVRPDAVWQFRADLMRYEILFDHGGFYADIDTTPLRPLGNLLDDLTEFAVMEDSSWIANTYLAAVPGHSSFKALIDRQALNCVGKRNAAAGVVSGPQYLTPIWRAHGRYVDTRTELWFPYSYTDVKRGTDWAANIGPQTYAIHGWQHTRDRMKK